MTKQTISARLSTEEVRLLEALARACGVTRTAYHRELLSRALQDALRDLAASSPTAYARFATELNRHG